MSQRTRLGLAALIALGTVVLAAWSTVATLGGGEGGSASGPGLEDGGAGALSPEAGVGGPRPAPKYGPDEVVRLVVEALGRNDEPEPDAGIRITFRFASPENRRLTGPIERFIALVKSEPYRSMIDHRGATYGPVRIRGDRAQQPVRLVGREGETSGYVFSLSRQREGRYKGCWMTDAVIPIERRDGGGEGEEGPVRPRRDRREGGEGADVLV